MNYLLHVGIFIALWGLLVSTAPDAFSQAGQQDNYCSVTTIYVTASADTFNHVAHDMTGIQHGDEAIAVAMTTTTTRTVTGFRTVTFTVNTPGMTRSATQFSAPTDAHFLHDGIFPVSGGSTDVGSETTTSETTASETTASETTASETTASETTANERAATETAAVQHDPSSATTQIEPVSGSGDVTVIYQTFTVYPLESISPEYDNKESHGPTSVSAIPPVTVTGSSTLSSTKFPTMATSVPSQPYITSSSTTPSSLPDDSRAIQPTTSTSTGYTGDSDFFTPSALESSSTVLLPINGTSTNQDSVLPLPSISLVVSDDKKQKEVNPAGTPSCGEQGTFSLNFDDLPPLSVSGNSNDVQPAPIFSPYHHFYFSEGFVIVPPPKDPYLPSSKPLLLEFLTESNINVTRNHNNPAPGKYGATGEIGNGANLHWGCYTFHALEASVGCDSRGPACDWQFTGVVYDTDINDYKEVFTQRVSTSSCPELENCALTEVVLLENFWDIQSLRINVTVAGVPKIWWMDDLKLAWADASCDAGLCRSMHR